MVSPLVLLAACVSITPLPKGTATPVADGDPASGPTVTHRPSSVPSLPVGHPSPGVASPRPSRSPDVLLREDFSIDGTWYDYLGDFGSIRTVDGAYRMRVGPDGGALYGTPNSAPLFDDTTVEVTVTFVEPAGDTYAAIACRGVDDFVWYELGVTSDGVAFISHVRRDGYEDLAVEDTGPLRRGGTVRLAATCRGSRDVALSLTVDGETVTKATDTDGLALGFVGLVASGEGGAILDFDDLLIRRP
ncbi:hypothetical protein BH24CHL8_BH24CHL8_08170 [soil metagenome]